MLRAIAVLAALIPLTACASLGGNAEANTQLLQNLRHCDRSYIGSLGGLAPPAASVSITCHAEPYDTPAKPEAPAQ